jgi:hypothetical protein
MRKSAQPTISFYARVDLETDKLRRRLQEMMGCSASELVKQAFRKLEACLVSDLNQHASGAYEAFQKRRAARTEQMKADLATALADPANQIAQPKPWSAVVTYYDGIAIQLVDANGKPVLGPDMLHDPDDAARIIHAVNR